MKTSAIGKQVGGVDHGLRLRSLWNAWLLAMLFHVELGLMPLFHGLSVKTGSQINPAQLALLFGTMLIYFLIPLAALLLIAYASSAPQGEQRWRPWRRLHLWLSIGYTATNIPHLAADMLVTDSRPDQVLLMLAMVTIGLLINLESWRWCRQ